MTRTIPYEGSLLNPTPDADVSERLLGEAERVRRGYEQNMLEVEMPPNQYNQTLGALRAIRLLEERQRNIFNRSFDK